MGDQLALGGFEHQASVQRSAALRYPGAKWSLASQVCAQFPKHFRYVEPYFGSGAVFFAKSPSPYEIINDRNAAVVNLFRVLRDRTDDLVWALESTPWARDEYDISDDSTDDELEAARRFVVRVWQAHASDLAKKTGWKTRGASQRARGMSIRWQRVPADLASLVGRLRDAEIENRDALEVIERFAVDDCLIYADPPYLASTRTQDMYAHEMTDGDHQAMLDVLCAHPGPVVLSGYDNEMYAERLASWHRMPLVPPKVEKGAERTEVLWIKHL